MKNFFKWLTETSPTEPQRQMDADQDRLVHAQHRANLALSKAEHEQRIKEAESKPFLTDEEKESLATSRLMVATLDKSIEVDKDFELAFRAKV